MTFATCRSGRALPRSLRDVMRLLVLGMYLIAGALHGGCNLDVVSSSSKIVFTLVDDGAGHSDRGALTDHHCHGCFSVSVPTPTIAAIEVMPTVEMRPALQVARQGLPPGIDPPPPKSLT